MKLNEFISRGDARTKDVIFLLGFFVSSTSQFSVQTKTDVNCYEAAFYVLFEEGDAQ